MRILQRKCKYPVHCQEYCYCIASILFASFHNSELSFPGSEVGQLHKGKSKKGKKQKEEATPSEEQDGTLQAPPTNKKRSVKKSFHRMAKIVKAATSSIDRGGGKGEDELDSLPEGTIPEEDEEGEGGEGSNGPVSLPSPSPPERGGEMQQQPLKQRTKKKRPPPRPSAITLRKDPTDYPKVTLTPSVSTGSTCSDESGSSDVPSDGKRLSRPVSPKPEGGGRGGEMTPKPPGSPHCLTSKSRSKALSSLASDDFFVVNYIHVAVGGVWLCVANTGGSVMAFNFCTGSAVRKQSPTTSTSTGVRGFL